MVFPPIIIGKFIGFISRLLNLGNGGTWPGEIALSLSPSVFTYFIGCLEQGLILITGTNGKTTTARMARLILEETAHPSSATIHIVHNDSGANLLNGLVSAFIQNAPIFKKPSFDWAILEVDEAVLPIVLNQLKSFDKKLIIIFLDLFRDQLDRYGEVDTIAARWEKALKTVRKDATIILNADDPQIAFLGQKIGARTIYFGIDKPDRFLENVEHAVDSTYCRACGAKLSYRGIYFSHLGVWFCPNCSNLRPKLDVKDWKSPLPGLYNEYNTLAAVALAKTLEIDEQKIKHALRKLTPAFGRQEEFIIKGKKIKIFLSKNPAGFNASLRTVLDLIRNSHPRPRIRYGTSSDRGSISKDFRFRGNDKDVILLVLNDRIPDGRDVSWIWDVDFEMIPEAVSVIVSGDRVYDIALRIKYAMGQCNNETMQQLKIIPELKKAIFAGLNDIKPGETLYILPTYSAMLEVRKVLKGRRIL